MHARTPLRDRVNVGKTVVEPFISNGEQRYRLTIEHGRGCRSEFVFDFEGAMAAFKQLGDAITVCNVPARVSA
jgi:hypothetical protein